MDHFEAVDKTTFKVVTKEPYAWTLHNIGNNLYSRLSWKFWWLNASFFLIVFVVGAGLLAVWR